MPLTFKPEQSIEPSAIRTIDFLPSGEELLVGRYSPDGTFLFGRLARAGWTWKEDLTWASRTTVTQVRFAGLDELIVFTDEASHVHVLDSTSERVTDAGSPSSSARFVSVARQGSLIALSSRTIEVWDLTAQVCLWRLNADNETDGDGPIACLDSEGQRLAVVEPHQGTVRLYSTGSHNQLGNFLTGLVGADHVAFHPGGQFLSVIGEGSRGCVVVDLHTNKPIVDGFCNNAQNNNLCQDFHPNVPLLAFGTIAGYVVLVDLLRNEMLYAERLHSSRIWDIRFSRDGKLLATAGDDGVIAVIPTEEMQEVGMQRFPI